MAERELWTVWLGRVPYADALELQRAVARARITGSIPQDVLLLLEHPPVVTLGRSSKEKHLVASPEYLAHRGVELFEVERGGDVTFHGPGQLVGYPILSLRRHTQDLHWYLRQVEKTLIRTVAQWDVAAERHPGLTGVWTNGRKIASIGVHARDWVTWHGFALNVTTDLAYFDLIVPCGIAGVTMTSLARETGAHEPTIERADELEGEGGRPATAGEGIALEDVAAAAAEAAGEVFALEPVNRERAEIEERIAVIR